MIIFVGCILLSAFSLIKERNYVYEEKWLILILKIKK